MIEVSGPTGIFMIKGEKKYYIDGCEVDESTYNTGSGKQ